MIFLGRLRGGTLEKTKGGRYQTTIPRDTDIRASDVKQTGNDTAGKNESHFGATF